MENYKKGFTLIELLVVVAIIGILASVVLAVLNNAKQKGNDAAVKSNLANARSQAEIFYNTNTAVPNTYTNICTTGPVGGASTISALITAAAKASGLTSYGINNVPAATGLVATCNDSANAWAAEVPLNGSTLAVPKMWCVDSTGASKQKATSIGAATSC